MENIDFVSIYRKYRSRAFNIGKFILGDEDEAEDIGLVNGNIDKATEDELDEDDDLDFSSVPDKSLNSYSTVFDSITSLPLSEQAKFASLIEQGEVSVTCR